MSSKLIELLINALCFLTAIPFHEAAHAYVADKLGDPTAKNMGRLTLNPTAHFDPMGALCMVLFGVGWAKGVPINTYNFKDRKKGMVLSALAGPVANFIMALGLLILAKTCLYTSLMFAQATLLTRFGYVLISMASVNIYLGVFNLIPVPPFDGSRILAAVLPTETYFKIMEYEQYTMFIMIFLIASGALRVPLNFLSNGVYTFLNFITGPVDMLFRMLL